MVGCLVRLGGKLLFSLSLPPKHIPPVIAACLFSSAAATRCLGGRFADRITRPPAPKKIPFRVAAHGRSWDDPYHWMTDTDDPDFARHLEEENAYADAFMRGTAGLLRKLLAEMKARMPPEISTPPERYGPWLYYQRVPAGKEYPILCRRLESHGGFVKTILGLMVGDQKEEILLDWNEIAEQYGYVHVGTCRVSPNHNFVAYTLDIDGRELFTLWIKDLEMGSLVEKSSAHGIASLAWAEDSNALMYTVVDETQRPYRVLYTILGSNNVDTLLFEENDANYCVDITSTKDGKFITVNSNSRISSEVYVVSPTNLKEGLQLVQKREYGVQCFLEHHQGYFYILTNFQPDRDSASEGYHIARCAVENLPSGDWQDVIHAGPDIFLEDMDIFDRHLVLFIQKNGSPMICSINMPLEVDFTCPLYLDVFKPWFFPLPPNICSITPGSNHDFKMHIYRAVLSSPVMPDLIVDFDMLNQKFSIVDQEKVVGVDSDAGCDLQFSHYLRKDLLGIFKRVEQQCWSTVSEAFVCERKEVISQDGVCVPLTIVYSKRSVQYGKRPGLLHGYGAYGEGLDKSWCSDHLSLLDRGWIIAYADVRGGGGGGISWHHSGSGLHKLNSVQDFVACARFLISEGYVDKDNLGAIGFSAGGLLLGAAINMFPDLFCAAILKVPFLDVCNTLLDPSLPLTVLDYQEFGDPRIPEEFETILECSPYENIKPGVCYPSMLITASFSDPRVGIWQPTKWVAKVRDLTCSSCARAIILKANMDGGHFGEGGRYKQREETALEYAFLIKAVGMLDK